MEIIKSGKHIIGAKLTNAEKKAMNAEIARQLAEFTRKYEIEIESIFLRELMAKYGFGEVRLKRAFDDFSNDLDEMIQYYELGEEDKMWLATKQLKDKGIDVGQWHREKYPKD
jgi:hypothetical protein